MTRFSGEVGFGFTSEDPPGSGKWPTTIETRVMRGDVVRNSSRIAATDSANPNVSLSHSISIVAGAYGLANYQAIRYVMWEGVRWTVTEVEVRRPRLILTLGEVYNGPTPE